MLEGNTKIQHSPHKDGQDINRQTSESMVLKPRTTEEASFVMNPAQLDAKIITLNEEIKKRQAQPKAAAPYYAARDVYTQRRDLLRKDQALGNIQAVNTRLRELDGDLYLVNVYIANPKREGPDTIYFKFMREGILKRKQLLEKRKEQIKQEQVEKERPKAAVTKASVPPVRRLPQHAPTRVTEMKPVVKQQEAESTPDRIGVSNVGAKMSPVEVFQGYSSAELETIKSSLEYEAYKDNIESSQELFRHTFEQLPQVEFSSFDRETINKMEHEVRTFFNKKFARLGIPANVPFAWPRIYYSQPRSTGFSGVTDSFVNSIDLVMRSKPNEGTGRNMTHEATHTFSRHTVTFTKGDLLPTDTFGIETFASVEHRGSYRRWNGLCNGLAIWNEAQIQFSEDLQRRFDKDAQARIADAVDYYSTVPPEEYLGLSHENLKLFGLENGVKPSLIRKFINDSGNDEDISSIKGHILTLTYTQELAKIAGYVAVRDQDYTMRNNYTLTGRDIMEYDLYTGTDRFSKIMSETFTEDELSLISKVNDRMFTEEFNSDIIAAMRIIKSKQKELQIPA